MEAPYNYWDDDTGPHNSSNNPSGTGNEVSDPVGVTPWNTHDHYLEGFSSVFSTGLLQWDGSTTYTTEHFPEVPSVEGFSQTYRTACTSGT